MHVRGDRRGRLSSTGNTPLAACWPTHSYPQTPASSNLPVLPTSMPSEEMLSSTAAVASLTPVAPVAPRPTREDDHRLAAACAGGDTLAFEDLYRRFGDRLKSIAFHHLGNVSDAEDA